jgi:hypothetical protein
VKIQDELEMMSRLFANPSLSMRLWVTSGHDGTTVGRLDWCVADHAGRRPHAVILSRFTWNNELDHVRRAMICAEELISSGRDKLLVPGATIAPSPGEQDYSDMRSKVRGH